MNLLGIEQSANMMYKTWCLVQIIVDDKIFSIKNLYFTFCVECRYEHFCMTILVFISTVILISSTNSCWFYNIIYCLKQRVFIKINLVFTLTFYCVPERPHKHVSNLNPFVKMIWAWLYLNNQHFIYTIANILFS